MKLDWEEPVFDAVEVSRIARIQEVKSVANWTDRGLVDPYHGSWEWKRGRGRARRYSLRDVLAFALMKDLSDRYEIPIPLGRRICAVVCGDFTPAHVGYTIIENVRADTISARFFSAPKALIAYLSSAPMASCLILDTRTLAEAVQGEAEKILAASGRNAAGKKLGSRRA